MKSLQQVSSVFFFAFGVLYFLLALIVQNKLYFPQSQIIFNILDMPFALIAILYAISSLCLTLNEDDILNKVSRGIIILTGIVLFFFVVGINIWFVDKL